MDEVEKALHGHVRERGAVRHRGGPAPDGGRRQAVPAAALLLAAETGTPAGDVLTAACVVELTHLASLYHDDVMDEADLRRGAESANARWDNHVAILTGDFLFSKSSELTAIRLAAAPDCAAISESESVASPPATPTRTSRPASG